jgi:hypothetical protein
MRYEELRNLRKLFVEDRDAFLQLASRIRGEEESAGWPPQIGQATDVETADTELLTGEDDDDDAQSPPPATASAYPKVAVRPHLQSAVDAINASSLDVLAQLQQAANHLTAVTSEKLLDALQGPTAAHVREALDVIIAWADERSTYAAQPDPAVQYRVEG